MHGHFHHKLEDLKRLLLRMTGENVDDPATDEVVTAD